jgi:hypothetical protein
MAKIKDNMFPPNNVTKNDAQEVQCLLNYFKKIKKKRELTINDFYEFVKKVNKSKELFRKYYRQTKDKFINDLQWFQLFIDADALKNIRKRCKESPVRVRQFVFMKDWSGKFINRFQKYFEPIITRNIKQRSEIEDSEEVLGISDKLTYRWAAGIVISNYLATVMTRLAQKTTKEKKLKTDDIKTLYDLLKGKSKNQKLRTFLTRSYRRFEDADKTRNRCAHINEGEPTIQEIGQSISLAKILKKYL